MEGVDNAHIRIGHAERNETVDRLRDAAGDGRLTLDELDERIGAAMGARTRADLRGVLADLLPPTEVELAVNPAGAVARSGEPGWAWQTPLVFTARWDDVVRSGTWEVPPFLEAHPVAANVKLNFVDAHVKVDRIDLMVVGGAGDVIVVVDEGWGVDFTHVTRGMGSLKSRVAVRPDRDKPIVVVRGQNRMGTIKARYSNRFDLWQRQRWLAKGGGIYAKN